jgi:pantoate--beta-alanine ligase
LKVIERMCRDLFLPIQVVAHPTVREADGLALSSRNLRLSEDERNRALSIVRGLRAATDAFERGLRNPAELESICRNHLVSGGLREDYVSCVDAEQLQPWDGPATADHALLAVAAFAGETRLIDNVVLGETGALQALGGEGA